MPFIILNSRDQNRIVHIFYKLIMSSSAAIGLKADIPFPPVAAFPSWLLYCDPTETSEGLVKARLV